MIHSKLLVIFISIFILTSNSSADNKRQFFNKSKTSAAGTQVPGTNDDIDGASILTRTSKGVGYTWNTRGLIGNRPHSNWWVVYNKPHKCAVRCKCTTADLANPDVQGGLFWATGRFTDGSGQANFSAYIEYGELPGGMGQIPNPNLDNPVSPGAEIQVFARKHGPTVDDGEAQRTQFNGGCPPNPIVPPDAGDGCQNVQFTTHRSPFCKANKYRRW